MRELIRINDKISYIKSSDNPLSSDVYLIKGDLYTWIFDVGSDIETLDTINSIEGQKNIIISHFHADHIKNLDQIIFNELYVSKNTYKYSNAGIIVDDDIHIDDGIKIHIFKVPSSHAKGCLALEIDEEYVFLGDAIYPKNKNGVREYNQQILYEEIKRLSGCMGEKFLLSHDKSPVTRKEVIVKYLETQLEGGNKK